jgi:hypothetical protein
VWHRRCTHYTRWTCTYVLISICTFWYRAWVNQYARLSSPLLNNSRRKEHSMPGARAQSSGSVASERSSTEATLLGHACRTWTRTDGGSLSVNTVSNSGKVVCPFGFKSISCGKYLSRCFPCLSIHRVKRRSACGKLG